MLKPQENKKGGVIMKALPYKIDDPTYQSLTTAIQRSTKHATSEFDYLMPHGWQLITKLRTGSITFFELHLEEGDGGSYAAVKMSTLEKYPLRAFTGDETVSSLLTKVEHTGFEDTIRAQEVAELESPSQLSQTQLEWLRDECKLTPMYGGIRIPYEFLINTDEPSISRGEILIAFDGASSQEQDAFFALWTLEAIQSNLAETQKNVQHSYDLRGLREDPVIHHWLTLMGIRDYDR